MMESRVLDVHKHAHVRRKRLYIHVSLQYTLHFHTMTVMLYWYTILVVYQRFVFVYIFGTNLIRYLHHRKKALHGSTPHSLYNMPSLCLYICILILVSCTACNETVIVTYLGTFLSTTMQWFPFRVS